MDGRNDYPITVSSRFRGAVEKSGCLDFLPSFVAGRANFYRQHWFMAEKLNAARRKIRQKAGTTILQTGAGLLSFGIIKFRQA